ncbi:MAG: hypothetical protein WD226_09915 [Planctomycetota bacterium]
MGALAGLFLVVAPLRAEADLAGALDRLGAATADVRAAAERELVRALEGVEATTLEELMSARDAEPRRRLARALAVRDEHFALILELTGGPLDDVALAALGGQIARWLPEPLERGKGGQALERDLGALASRSERAVFAVRAGANVRSSLAALQRQAETPFGLALDPALEENARTDAATGGSWLPVVQHLSAALPNADLLGYGVDPFVPVGERRGWVAIVPRAASARTSTDLLVDWCRATSADDPFRRTRAVAALFATGWPAAVRWVATLAAAGDPLARGVLLDAAAEGGVAPVLALDVERTLAELDALLPVESVRAHRRLDALIEHPPALGPDALFANWDALAEPARWARWVLLGAWGTRAASAERASELARRELARRELDPRFVEPVLAALAAREPGSSRAAFELTPHATELVLAEWDARRLELLVAARVDPSPAVEGDVDPVALVAWRLGRGAVGPAAELAVRHLALAGSSDLYPALLAWRDEAALVARFLDQLVRLADADSVRVRRLRFLAGHLPAPEAGAYLRELRLPALGASDLDLQLLTRLVVEARGPRAGKALELLRFGLAQSAQRDKEAPVELMAAFDRVIDGFTATGRDVEIDPVIGFLEELMRVAQAPWVPHWRGRWPLPPRVRTIELERADPRWEL